MNFKPVPGKMVLTIKRPGSAKTPPGRPLEVSPMTSSTLPDDWPTCACGCGKPVGAAKSTGSGLKRGQPNRYLVGHAAVVWQRENAVSLEERFWSKVQKTDTCWIWVGGKISGGYGSLGPHFPARLAHRYAYEALVGPIPEGLVIDHLCRNRACVNPDHMEPVTDQENLHRGRVATGWINTTHCKHGHELTPDNVVLCGPGKRHRRCRECRRESLRRWYRKKTA